MEGNKWYEKHPRLIFWLRFVLWAMASCILPFCFIAFRFDLFSKISKISISGFGIIGIIIVFVFIFSVLTYLKKGFKGGYNFWLSCIKGVIKITLPLLLMCLLINCAKDNIDNFLQVLCCVTLCETIAIPLNPMPKWVYDRQKHLKEEERKGTIEYIADMLGKKKDEN